MKLVEQAHGKEIDVLLRDMYLEKHMTMREIADALGVGVATVKDWLTLFDIQTRHMTFV